MDGRYEEARHPIGVAAERTGLSADVIRAWERRYGAIAPARDGSGHRRYSDAEVERLRLLRRATEAGRSIGDVAGLGVDALAELVRGDEAARREAGSLEGGVSPVPDLMARALALDGDGLESGLRQSLMERGFAAFAEEVAAPLLRGLGDGWHAGEVTVAQEHLATAALRRVLETTRAASLADGASDGRPTVVVATLEGERHEVGALLAATSAALAGWRVAYLGTGLPVAEVLGAVDATGARAVCVSGTYEKGAASLVSALRGLRAGLPSHVEVFAGGLAARGAADELEGAGVRCPPSLMALRAELRSLAEAT